MTIVPYVPNWCWNLLGEDAVYFSQKTAAGPCDTPFAETGACIARCGMQSQLGEIGMGDAGGVQTHPIQCGTIATIAPDGDMLCSAHVEMLWNCEYCGAWLPEGAGGTCQQYGRVCGPELTMTEEELDEAIEGLQERLQAEDEERFTDTDEDGPPPA